MTDCQPPHSPSKAEQRIERMKLAAPVDPVSDDGVRAFGLGTLVFAAATLVVAVFGRGWWPEAPMFEICATGTLIGVVGFWWCRRRRQRIAAENDARG